MTEHTPTPWKGPLQSRDCKERNIIDDADGNALFMIVGITAQSRGSRKRIRDAAVVACNARKDLLDACKMCLAACYMNLAEFLNEESLAKLAAAIEKGEIK